MTNDRDDVAELKAELTQLRLDTALVVHTLDCAMQTVDALLAWMPEGLSLSPEVSGCKQRLDAAMRVMTGRKP
jgi:hypothetical protein